MCFCLFLVNINGYGEKSNNNEHTSISLSSTNKTLGGLYRCVPHPSELKNKNKKKEKKNIFSFDMGCYVFIQTNWRARSIRNGNL